MKGNLLHTLFRKENGMKLNRRTIILAVLTMFLVSVTAVWAASVDPEPLPGSSNDGKTCADVLPGTIEFKYEVQ